MSTRSVHSITTLLSTATPHRLHSQLLPTTHLPAPSSHLPPPTSHLPPPQVKYIAGGATQNSCRVCQWMTGVPGATSYFGCIGDDAFGKQMADEAAAIGMNVQYLVDPEQVRGVRGRG